MEPENTPHTQVSVVTETSTVGQTFKSIHQQQENIPLGSQDEKYKTAHKVDYTAAFDENNFAKTEGLNFVVPCHSCGMMGETKMCETSIPFFSDIIIMSFSCEYCGAHSTDTKTSGQIKEFGTKIVLKNPQLVDLKRQLFKSQTCAVQIPELQLELDYGTLGGVLTTVEGLLEKIYDHLNENNPFVGSDKEFAEIMDRLLDRLEQCSKGNLAFTLILVDPLSHSFLQNPHHPKEDSRVTVEKFQRTQDQNEFLGLLDINVDHYIK